MILIRCIDVISFLAAAAIFVRGCVVPDTWLMAQAAFILVGSQFILLIFKVALGYKTTAWEGLLERSWWGWGIGSWWY